MKKQLVTIILIFIITFTLACSRDSNWAAIVDGHKISMKDFNAYYYTQNKIMLNLATNEEVDQLAEQAESLDNPQLQQLLVKTNFLDQLIAQRLVYNRAFSDKSIDKKEMDAFLKFTRMQAIASYYMAQKLRDRIEVTDEEVEEFFYANRQHFRGIPLNEETIERLRQQLVMQKTQFETQRYLMELLTEAKVDRKGLALYLQSEADRKEIDRLIEEEKALKEAETADSETTE